MKKKIFGKSTLPLLAALCMYSCTDYDYGFSEKQMQYDEHFKDVFGDIDPNQDWSMATRVRADVNVPNLEGEYKMNILTGNPSNSETRLLAQTTLVDGKASLSFDGVKGMDKVYITAERDGKYALCQEYSIVEDQLLVGNVTRSVATRAAGDPICQLYNSEGGGVDGVVTSTCVEQATVPYPIVWKDGTDDSGKMSYSETFDWTLYSSQNFATKGSTTIGNFYEIPNIYKADAPNRSLSLMYSLFYTYTKSNGEKVDAPFKEFDNHVRMYMGERKEHALSLESDATLLTSGGETTLTYVGKGTNLKNDIGYFYYPKADESNYLRSDGTLNFDKVKKFVIFKDMSNSGDLLKGTNPYSITQQLVYTNFSAYQDAVNKGGSNEEVKIQTAWYPTEEFTTYKWNEATFTGTKFKLAYFGDGETPTETGSYDFPANYVVGFFGVQTERDASKVTHVFCSVASVEKNYFNDYPRGAVFRFAGNTYLGLEDDSDYDINDYLFELAGFETRFIPDVTPEPQATVEWHNNFDATSTSESDVFTSTTDNVGTTYYNPNKDNANNIPTRYGYTFKGWAETRTGTPTMDVISGTIPAEGKCYYAIWEQNTTPDPEPYMWIIACEDLGGTDDYDFNDVVIGLQYDATNQKLKVTPLAAGGTLKSYVFYNEQNLGEIHAMLKNTTDDAYVASGSMAMLNTSGSTKLVGNPVEIPGVTNYTVTDSNMGGISIKVLQKDYKTLSETTQATAVSTIKYNKTGEAPQMLLLPQSWEWPTERMEIGVKYPGFKTWTSNSKYSEWIVPSGNN